MDRYNRFPVRGGISCNNRDCGTMPTDNPRSEIAARQSDCCLCTTQPISLAMAYVKDQPFENLNCPEDALRTGTLFSDLYMPYCSGGGGCRRC